METTAFATAPHVGILAGSQAKRHRSPLHRCTRASASPEVPVALGPFKVFPLAVGTWAWGNQVLYDYQTERDANLQGAFDATVTSAVQGVRGPTDDCRWLFDTGDSYGTGKLNGRAETLLGRFDREAGGPPGVVMATKLASYPWRLTPASIEGACRRSMERMGRESLDLAQIHWSTANYAPWQEKILWEGFARLHEKGLAKAIGVSNYGPKQLAKIANFLQERGVPLASNQVQLSLLCRQPVENGLMDVCKEYGIQPIGYSPLTLGFLTGKYSSSNAQMPKGPRGLLFRRLLSGSKPLFQTMSAIADERDVTLAQVAINWSLCQNVVTLVGAKTADQALQNVGAAGWRLSGAECQALEQAARKSDNQMIENVFQTR